MARAMQRTLQVLLVVTFISSLQASAEGDTGECEVALLQLPSARTPPTPKESEQAAAPAPKVALTDVSAPKEVPEEEEAAAPAAKVALTDVGAPKEVPEALLEASAQAADPAPNATMTVVSGPKATPTAVPPYPPRGGMAGMMMGGGGSSSMIFMMIIMGLSGGILACGSTVFWALCGFIGSFFTAEVDIEVRSEAYKWLEFWMSQCPQLEERSTRFRLALSRELGPQVSSTNRAARLADAAEAAHKTNEPVYLPRDGESTRISFNGWWLWIKMGVTKEGANGQPQPSGPVNLMGGGGEPEKSIRITAPFRNKAKITELLNEACKLYTDKLKTHTMIWTVAGGGGGRARWRVLDARPTRPLDTVVLEGGVAQNVCKDVQRFLQSEQWYVARGVPYRRGYLLHGPPGCGKTSFITALAGELHLVICIINLASRELTDDSLLELLSEAPRHSILLLEDVDAAFKTAPEPSAPAADSAGGRGIHNRRMNEGAGITFSGVLNAIDGVAAQEGKVLFLTTNHSDRLDEALVRPGRVDMRIHLGLATQETARRLFLRFYKDTDLGGEHGESSQEMLQALADEFSSKVPDGKISPATIQGLLMDHRDCPRSALLEVDRLAVTLPEPSDGASETASDSGDKAGGKPGRAHGSSSVSAASGAAGGGAVEGPLSKDSCPEILMAA